MPLQPSVTTVQFGEVEFDSFATEFSVYTPHDDKGMPLMGANAFAIQVSVDMQDTANLPFNKVKTLFDHAHNLTSDKVKDCKITFWSDDSRQNALSTFAFKGWIMHLSVLGGGGQNHLLILKLQPRPGEKQFAEIQHGN